MAMTVGGVVRLPGEGSSLPGAAPGAQIVWKATVEDTEGAYSLQEFTVRPGQPGVPLHVHETEEEAFYILEGEVTFQIGDRAVRAPSGSFVLVPRGVVHGHTTTGTQPARWLAIFSPPGMGRYFEERAALVATTSPDAGQVDYSGLEPARHAALASKYRMRFVGEG